MGLLAPGNSPVSSPNTGAPQPLDLGQLNKMAGSETASERSFRLKVEGSGHKPLMMARRNQNNHASRLMMQDSAEQSQRAKEKAERDRLESKSTKNMGDYTLHYKMNDKT